MAKRQYGKWSHEDMTKALEEYKSGKIKFNKCCMKHNIPKPTVKRHLDGKVKRSELEKAEQTQVEENKKIKNKKMQEKRRVNGRLPAIPMALENDLVKHILIFEECLFGLTITDVRKLAYDLMEANSHLFPNPFSRNKSKMAGKNWYYRFMSRHPKLALRQPENTSIARCKGFNRENVYGFFDLLEKVVDEHKIDAQNIYNVDESGFSTVQKKSPKVIAQRGKHQVGFIASGERGVNTTIVCCCNASGNFVPPMVIFKRVRMHPALKNGAFPNSLTEVSESGYINSELFVKWLKHFIQFVKPTENQKVLLLLDGHTTHSKNLAAINLARQNNVIILQLPGHTTHRLQPLDVGVFKSIESSYSQIMTKWLRFNPGEKVTQFEVNQLLTEAYVQSATTHNAMSGFRASGVWPVDRRIFTESDFVASENLQETVVETTENLETTKNESVNNIPAVSDNVVVVKNQDDIPTEVNPAKVKATIVTLHQLSPLPKPTKKHSKRLSKGVQKATLITSSPYKNDLEEKMKIKENKENKANENKNKKNTKKSAKRNVFVEKNLKAEEKVTELANPKKAKISKGNVVCYGLFL